MGNSEVPSSELLTQEQVEAFVRRGKEEVENLLELSEDGFFDEGSRYGFEQITGEGDWGRFNEEQKVTFLKGVGLVLGVPLVNYREEDVLRREFQEGVEGERTQLGADVTVLKTRYTDFEVHVMSYREPALATRYDIVRK